VVTAVPISNLWLSSTFFIILTAKRITALDITILNSVLNIPAGAAACRYHDVRHPEGIWHADLERHVRRNPALEIRPNRLIEVLDALPRSRFGITLNGLVIHGDPTQGSILVRVSRHRPVHASRPSLAP
jgi:hypothetical protein